MENEITSSNEEPLSLCLRHVDSNKELTKSFLKHAELECKTGFHYPKKLKVCETRCRCQREQKEGNAMTGQQISSRKNQGPRHLERIPWLKFCYSHNLNLSLAASCKMEIIANIYENKNLQIYFNISLKRDRLLEFLANKKCLSDTKPSTFLCMCNTR